MLDEALEAAYIARFAARYALFYIQIGEEVAAIPPPPPIHVAPLKKLSMAWSPLILRPVQAHYLAGPNDSTRDPIKTLYNSGDPNKTMPLPAIDIDGAFNEIGVK